MLFDSLFVAATLVVTAHARFVEPRYDVQAPDTADGTSPAPASPTPSDPGTTITAYTDGQCQNDLESQRNESYAKSKFIINKKFPEYETILPQEFPGADKDETGGWGVWWDIPQPPDTCRYIVMLPYSTNNGWPNKPVGNEIINVARRGCYFGAVPANGEFYMTMCCGTSCEDASLGSASLLAPLEMKPKNDLGETVQVKKPTPEESEALQKASLQPSSAASPTQDHAQSSALAVRGVADQPILPQARSSEKDYMKAVRRAVEKLSETPTSGSPAAKAKALVSRYWYDAPGGAAGMSCSATQPTNKFARSGPQIRVSPSQICSIGSCSVSVTYSSEFSTTITSQHDTTFTNGGGFSVSLTTGVDLLAKATTELTTSYTWSKAVTDSTGKDVLKGQSDATANNIAFVPGQRQFVSFTPIYECYTSNIQCDNGTPEPFDICQPVFINQGESDQKIVDGDYTVVVSDA